MTDRVPAAGRLALHVWQATLVAGVAVLVAHYGDWFGLLGPSSFIDTWVYDVVEVAAAATCLARGVVYRSERPAWLAIGTGLLALAGGDLLWDFAYGGDPPFPSWADAAYLGFYPALYLGLLLLLRLRISTFNASLWLDGLTAALAAGAVGASVLLEVVVASTHGAALTVLTNLAYPLGDIVLLALLVFVFAVNGWRPGRAWSLIGLALVVNTVGDGIYLYQTALGTYSAGTYLDAVWPTSLVLVALAAWQAPAKVQRGRLAGRTLIGTPLVCGLIATGVFVYASVRHVHPLAIGLAAATVILVLVRTALTFRENSVLLVRSRTESLTDALTGLGNRRKLVNDLGAYLVSAESDAPHVLATFDLNGFKTYNDSFGHLAGDALLVRLANKLAAAVEPDGRAYRMGGDEFCVLAPASAGLLERAASSLEERGDSFSVATAYGAVALPEEAVNTTSALGIADQRLYAHKDRLSPRRGRPHELILRILAEREPELREHVAGVATLALAVGRALDLPGDALEELRLAAELHDVGKLAVPDAVLDKPGPLNEEEQAFIRQHTVVGQRILAGVPSLSRIAALVRSTHEAWDGNGYPDGLTGEQIPLAARVIAVCDAFSAMTSHRPYRAARGAEEAIAELRRCAGTQFDPELVELFCRLRPDLAVESELAVAI